MVEPADKVHEYMISEGYELDINENRFHHKIYVSDVGKTAPEKLKTVIRYQIRKKIKAYTKKLNSKKVYIKNIQI